MSEQVRSPPTKLGSTAATSTLRSSWSVQAPVAKSKAQYLHQIVLNLHHFVLKLHIIVTKLNRNCITAMLFKECTLQAALAPQASVQSFMVAAVDVLRAVARLEWGCRMKNMIRA